MIRKSQLQISYEYQKCAFWEQQAYFNVLVDILLLGFGSVDSYIFTDPDPDPGSSNVADKLKFVLIFPFLPLLFIVFEKFKRCTTFLDYSYVTKMVCAFILIQLKQLFYLSFDFQQAFSNLKLTSKQRGSNWQLLFHMCMCIRAVWKFGRNQN